jgi:hypothetical protein
MGDGSHFPLIKVDHPHRRSLSRSAHQAGRFQHRMHAFRRVKKCPKRVAFQLPPRVLEGNESSYLTAIPRIGERD